MPMKVAKASDDSLQKTNPHRKFKNKIKGVKEHPVVPAPVINAGHLFVPTGPDWVAPIKANVDKAKDIRSELSYKKWLRAYSWKKTPFTQFILDKEGNPDIYQTRVKHTKAAMHSVKTRVQSKRPAHLKAIEPEFITSKPTPGWRGQRPPTLQELWETSKVTGERMCRDRKIEKVLIRGAEFDLTLPTGEFNLVRIRCCDCNKGSYLTIPQLKKQAEYVPIGQKIHMRCDEHFEEMVNALPWEEPATAQPITVLPSKLTKFDDLSLYGTVHEKEDEDPYSTMLRSSVTGVMQPCEFTPFETEGSEIDPYLWAAHRPKKYVEWSLKALMHMPGRNWPDHGYELYLLNQRRIYVNSARDGHERKAQVLAYGRQGFRPYRTLDTPEFREKARYHKYLRRWCSDKQLNNRIPTLKDVAVILEDKKNLPMIYMDGYGTLYHHLLKVEDLQWKLPKVSKKVSRKTLSKMPHFVHKYTSRLTPESRACWGKFTSAEKDIQAKQILKVVAVDKASVHQSSAQQPKQDNRPTRANRIIRDKVGLIRDLEAAKKEYLENSEAVFTQTASGLYIPGLNIPLVK